MFELYKKEKIQLVAPFWEDLVSFVEIIKKYNKDFINRKDFVVKHNNNIIYCWKRK